MWPFSRANQAPEKKENPIGGAFYMPAGNDWTRPTKRRQYVEEGYQLNVIVYRCVMEICRALSDLTLEAKLGDDVLDTHPALDLLDRPNPAQGWDGFIQQAFIDYMLQGEMAINTPNEGQPAELWITNPIYLEVMPGRSGLPVGYKFKKEGYEKTFRVMPDGTSDLFFMKTYNPLDYWRGQSPLMASALAADTHNAGLRWNYKVLKNSARPSGLIKFEGTPQGETIARLREFFKEKLQGENNAGEIPMLTGGAEWVPMDQNARDMDFMNTQKESAKLIASSFGVPLPLIDNDASTFNNLELAKERFYTDTIIPMFNEFLAQFALWLMPRFGTPDVKLQIDLDQIPALEASRERKFNRMVKAVQAGVLTVDEVRVAIGYPEVGGAAAMLDPVGAMFNPTDVKAIAGLAYGAKAN
jgi:HK97 family phage portal protein